MSPRQEILLQILRQGILNCRLAARQGHAAEAEIEADHLHNVLDIIAADDEESLRRYWCVDRLGYKKRCHNRQFRSSFAALWSELEDANRR